MLMHRGLPQSRVFTTKAACCSACFLLIVLQAIASAYSGGSGTAAEPYRIGAVSDWQELMASPADWDSHFVLIADIDLKNVQITPIGNTSERFCGVFDGNHYVVCNAEVNIPGSDYVGLFSYMGELGRGGQIKNLGVEDISIVGGSFVGGLLGMNQSNGTISNCYLTGSVSGGESSSYVGSLVGVNYGTVSKSHSAASVNGVTAVGGVAGTNSGTINNCYSTGSVSGEYGVGGLVGTNWETISDCYSTGYVSGGVGVGGLVGGNVRTISNCYSTGSVSGTDNYVGGLVGNNNIGTISNCCSTATVKGTASYVGGLVGQNNDGTIDNCYSKGSVSGGGLVGGLVGYNNRGTISNCYSTGLVKGTALDLGGLIGVSYLATSTNCFWDTQTSGMLTSDGGTGKTTVEMKQEGTFTNWDFVDTWDIIENVTYPFLRLYIPYIMVTSPNGGESWERGTSHSITWNSSGSVGSHVKIELYKGESLNMTITSSTSNDGSYSWIISSSQTTDSDYKVKVTSTSDSSVYDHSDSYFSILMGIIGDFCGVGSDQPDGYVDYWDLLYFAQRWHTRLGDPLWDPRCDLAEENSYVDYWDLLVFAQNWHKGEPP